MEHRSIGTGGIAASVIGLGTEHLDGKSAREVDAVVSAALDGGINLLDVFMPGQEVRRNIGRALRGKRDQTLIQGHIGSVEVAGQYAVSRDIDLCTAYFESLLRALGVDRIDIGMLFFMDKESSRRKVVDGPILPYVRRLKEQGVIRAVGASAHNPAAARRLVEEGLIDLLMFSVNPAFDMAPAGVDAVKALDQGLNWEKSAGNERAALYRLCEASNVPIVSMKTLGAGKLLDGRLSPFAAPLSVSQCIHYALTRPAVASALVGCSSVEEVGAALAYLEASPEERDFSGILERERSSFAHSCVYCNHCRPCPAGIDIAAVNRALDAALLDGQNAGARVLRRYRSLDKTAASCTACGVCEARCPFSVPIVERMAEARRLFDDQADV
ncbi:MAG: aldo/keto reductase [Spirochaetaceae bacterium]|jgi:predicted aldo/keto reductase-like oxidoreductase|nr:aldo/keto reductase [Spirochaetaceae bacterium]